MIGVIVFTGLTAYDTQRIKESTTRSTARRWSRKAIFGALSLYSSFINMFVMLLQLFGSTRN